LPRGLLAGLALLDAVDLGTAVALELALHAGQALVDAVPAGGDEVDEQRQVVHAGMALGQEVVLEAFQPADRLPGQAAHLCELPADRSRFGPHALAHCILDSARKRRLELRRELCERLDLRAGPLERSVDVALGGAPACRVVQSFSCACHRSFVHGPER
jgi:hypothetical protein